MTSLTDSQRLVRTLEREKMVKTAASLTASVHKDAPMPRASATADSSGFVDMSAFSAADPDWIERALASTRGNAPAKQRPQPTPTVRGMLLAPQTLAPVAISDLATSRAARSSSRHRSAFVAGVVGACFVIGVAAVVVKVLQPAPVALATNSVTDAMREAAVAAFVTPTPAPALGPTLALAPTPTPTAPPSAPTLTPAQKSPPRAQPAPRPKSAPVGAPRPASGGSPSLEEMMRRAAQPPSAKPKK